MCFVGEGVPGSAVVRSDGQGFRKAVISESFILLDLFYLYIATLSMEDSLVSTYTVASEWITGRWTDVDGSLHNRCSYLLRAKSIVLDMDWVWEPMWKGVHVVAELQVAKPVIRKIDGVS